MRRTRGFDAAGPLHFSQLPDFFARPAAYAAACALVDFLALVDFAEVLCSLADLAWRLFLALTRFAFAERPFFALALLTFADFFFDEACLAEVFFTGAAAADVAVAVVVVFDVCAPR